MVAGTLLVVGTAVAKLLLRASDHADAADAVGDVQEGWARLRRRSTDSDRVGQAIAQQLEARLGGVRDSALRDDLRAAARDVGDLIERLAGDDAAIRVAASHPEAFYAYALEHGGNRLLVDTSRAAEPVFEAVLAAATDELCSLAPWSPRFQSAALTTLLTLAELLPGIAADAAAAAGDAALAHRYARQAAEDVARLVLPTVFPIALGHAPGLATAYQVRAPTQAIPDRGTVVLTGPGGYGKTQIAAESYASRPVDLKIWVPASTADSIQVAYAEAALALRLHGPDLGTERLAGSFLDWLAASADRRWRVVLDDVSDPGALRVPGSAYGLWPPLSPVGLTVATTRSRAAGMTGEGRRRVDVDHYTPDEALAYLTARLQPQEAELGPDPLRQAAGLAEDLGLHPLALAQAAAVILDEGSTVADYRAQLASATLEQVLPESAAADGYPRGTGAAWELALRRGQQHDDDAAEILLVYALLDPAGAPDDLLWAGARSGLRVLHQLSLLDHLPRLGSRAVRVHPLTARLARESAPRDVLEAAASFAAQQLMAAWPSIENDPVLADALRGSTEALVESAPAVLLDESGDAHPIYFRLIDSFGSAGLVQNAKVAAERLLDALVPALGPDHPHALAARAHSALWRGQAGDPGGAAATYEAVLADQLRVLGPTHPSTLNTRRNLAAWRGEAGDLVGAADALTTLLAEELTVRSARHPDTMTTRNSLAVAIGQLGDAAGAAEEFEALLADQLEVLGSDDLETHATRANLAHFRGLVGDPARAIGELEALLADQVRTYGPSNLYTLINRGNLAGWRDRAGDPAGAVVEYETLLIDQLRVLGPDHPSTLLSRHNLAGVLARSGDRASAALLARRLVDDERRVLGPDHPDTLATRANLAHWTGEGGDPGGAAAACAELLQDQVRVLGPDHPDVLATRAAISQWSERARSAIARHEPGA